MSLLEFKEIPSHSNYRINRFGKIWSDLSNKFMNPTLSNRGYLRINAVNDEGVSKTKAVHQLMAISFLGHKPNGLSAVVDHIDNNAVNNRLENLQLVSIRENSSKDKYRIKKSGLPLNIHLNNGSDYSFKIYYNGKHFGWGFKTLEQAIEMKEFFEYLTEVDGIEYAIKTLDENRAGRGKKSEAELYGDLIKL